MTSTSQSGRDSRSTSLFDLLNRSTARTAAQVSRTTLPFVLTLVASVASAQTDDRLRLDFPAFDPAAVDPSVDPCVDFYAHACGGWREAHPMPPDASVWSRPWSQYAREVDELLEALVEHASVTTDERRDQRTDDEQKVGDYYTACMDVERIDQLGLGPIAPQLAAIDRTPRAADLPALLGQLQRDLLPTDRDALLFAVHAEADPLQGAQRLTLWIEAGRLGLPSRNSYLDQSQPAKDLRLEYRNFLATQLRLLEATPQQQVGFDHDQRAEAVIQLETKLAEARLELSVLRNEASARENLLDMAELQQLTPGFGWRTYFATLGLPSTNRINVVEPDFLRRVDQLLRATPLPVRSDFLKLRLLSTRPQLLPETFRRAYFEFYGRILSGLSAQPSRSATCIGQIDRDLANPLSRVFLQAVWEPKLGERTAEIFETIRAAFAKRIRNASWLDPATQARALEKLEAVRLSVGSPSRWPDDPKLVVRPDDAYGNSRRAAQSSRRAEFHGLDRPLDPDAWDRPPTWVGGYYENGRNGIVMTAAQLLYFADGLEDPAILHGGLGVFLGHELSHGFDPLGRSYDAQGRLRDWWTSEDGDAFDEKAQCVADHYSSYSYAPGIPVNGELVVSEQTAELVGWTLAWDAFVASAGSADGQQAPDRGSARRFFLASAQVLCYEATEESWRVQATSDSHAFGAPGLNGTVTNLPAFSEVFECRDSAPMTKPSAEVCSVW